MKRRKQILACLMAASMLATSVQPAWVTTAYAADSQKEVVSGALTWNSTKVPKDAEATEDNGYKSTKYTISGSELTKKVGFLGKAYRSTYTIDASDIVKKYMAKNDAKIISALSGAPASGTVTSEKYKYTWYHKDSKGEWKELSNTKKDLEVEIDLTNTADNSADSYKVKVELTEANVDGTICDVDSKKEVSLVYIEDIAYTGPTADTITSANISDLVSLEGFSETDETLEFSGSNTNITPKMFSIGANKELYGTKAEFDYTLTAKLENGSTITRKSSTVDRLDEDTIGSLSRSIYDDDDDVYRQVSSYQLKVDVKYGDLVVKTYTKNYVINFNPVTAYGVAGGQRVASDGSFTARGHEKVKLEVNYYSEDADIDHASFSWYTVDATGAEKVIPGATMSAYYATVSDYSVKYRCRALFCTEDGENITQVFDFKPAKSSGYLLKDISDYKQYANLGESVTLSASVATDNGYTVNYRWDKVTKDASGNLAFTQVNNTTNTYFIQAAAKSDFDKVMVDSLGDYATHMLTITVTNGSDYTKTETFYFDLTERVIEESNLFSTFNDTNDSEHSIYDEDHYKYEAKKGEDVKLYFKKSDSNATYSKIWYKAVACIDYTYTKGADGNYSWTPKNAAITAPAADYVQNNYFSSKNPVTGQYTTVKRVEYYKAIGNTSDELILPGNTDVTGTYLCLVNKTANNTTTQLGLYKREVVYDTDLTAYAKNEVVEANVNSPAKLQVIANNCDTAAFPMAYTWFKKDANGQYVKLEGVATPTYDIPAVNEGMYGSYRVLVNNSYDSEVVDIELTKVAELPTFTTPENSYFEAGIGSTVNLEVNGTNLQNAQFVWYKTESYVSSNYYYTADNRHTIDWQLLGQTASKVTFTADATNRTTYKCDAIYTENGVYKIKTFLFFVQDDEVTTVLATTPTRQYFNVGDTANYGVSFVSESANVTEATTTYQWQRYDENKDAYVNIEGATAATFSEKLDSAEKFGWVRCLVTYSKNHEPGKVAFHAQLSTDVTLEKVPKEDGTFGDYEEVKAEKGSTVTIAPKVNNPSNHALTYQWYKGYQGGRKLYGSTASSYTITDLAESDCGTYTCEIYQDGIQILTYVVNVQIDDENEIVADVADGFSKNIEAILGTGVNFAVKTAQKKAYPLTYQWYVRPEGYVDDVDPDVDEDENAGENEDIAVAADYAGRGWKAIGGATADKYSIGKAVTNDAGEYMCVVKDDKGHEAVVVFTLKVGTGIKVESGYENMSDCAGYPTTIGGNVTLTANANNMNSGYGIFYQWFKYDENSDSYKAINGATNSTLALTNVSEKDLGYYCCQVYDGLENKTDLKFKVYVNSELTVIQTQKNVIASSDGKVKMAVKATAKKGTEITYQWQKKTLVNGVEKWTDIEGQTGASYTINEITKASYGYYRVATKVPGDTIYSTFDFGVMVDSYISREYAEQGDKVVVKTALTNKAKDASYNYVWYEEDLRTHALKKVDNTSNNYSAKAPKLVNPVSWKDDVTYKCKIYDGDPSDEKNLLFEVEKEVNVLSTVTYKKSLPETAHPVSTDYDVQGYTVAGAKSLCLTVDEKSESALVIDGKGNSYHVCGGCSSVKIEGNKAIVVYTGDSVYDHTANKREYGYGYKVVSAKSATTTISLKAKKATYTGKAIQIGKASVKGSKGKVTYNYYSDKNCTKLLDGAPVNVGTYYVVAKVKDDNEYFGKTSKAVKLTITKATAKIKVNTTAKTFKESTLKKKAQTFSIGASSTATLSYKKLSGGKNFSINSKTGIVTVKKNTKKGVYTLKVKISAKADKNNKASKKTATIKVVVK